MSVSVRHILAPTDFSDTSRRAVHYAVELAEKFDARVTLLHIVQDLAMVLPDAMMPMPAPAPSADDFQSHGRKLLAELIEREKLPAGRVDSEVVVGAPSSEIVAFAKEHNIDLIVMGTHGRSGLSHILLGSVAERVLRHAPCPVLTVREKEEG